VARKAARAGEQRGDDLHEAPAVTTAPVAGNHITVPFSKTEKAPTWSLEPRSSSTG
jgi:hypothetical protein